MEQEPTTEIPIRILYDLQRICWTMNNFLGGTTIDTIPYSFTTSSNPVEVSNLMSDLTCLGHSIQEVIESMDIENPLEKRKGKLGNYLLTDIEERISKLEKENQELKMLKNPKKESG